MSSLDESRIWVGGLPDGIAEDEIKDEFKKYGEITYVQIRANPGAPCFAFVQYTDRHDAEDAIAGANQAKLFGQAFVKVSWAGKSSKGKGKGKRDDRSRSRSQRNSRSRSRCRSHSDKREPSRRSPARKRSSSPPWRKNSRDRSPEKGRGSNRQVSRQRSPPPPRPPSRDRRRSPPQRRAPSIRRSPSARRETPRQRSVSASRREEPSRQTRARSPVQSGRGAPTQGKYRVQVEKLPEDMGWQELKDVGTKFAKSGQCTFARTRRDQTGILEFTSAEDMAYAIKELDGRRFSGGGTRVVAYEDKSR